MTLDNPDTADGLAALLAAYRPAPGTRDEMLDETGAIRPLWQSLMGRLAEAGDDEISTSFLRGDQYLRDAGVYFRDLDNDAAGERDWALSHVPVLIDEAEWNDLATGLIERADLLEHVVADLYGDATLIADGHLPAALIANNPGWLRPLVGVKPRSGHYLNFIAFEIGRGPNGEWWVLSDRTEAPAGAGFALEKRVATNRIYSEHFPKENVLRLAGFFRAFRESLSEMRTDRDSRLAVLTPGPSAPTYFEDAYIARYLGMLLLRGEDLTTENGRLMVRTVAGLRPIDVLWRRVSSGSTDPLELNEASIFGTPGLLGPVREGNASLINALGSGVAEARAMLAFLPRISEALTGKPLAIPNVATWWCGQPDQHETVMAHGESMVIGPAQSTHLPFDSKDMAINGADFTSGTHATLRDWIAAEGPRLVGQEAVRLSTTPAFVDGALVPRPMNMRVFLARTGEGWQVMPGGFARVSQSETPTAMSMRTGGRVADVWVISDTPVQEDTMLASAAVRERRPRAGTLPSLASENLYWLGRYVERAEGLIRLLRAYHTRLAEGLGRHSPLLDLMASHFEDFGVDETEPMPTALLNALDSAMASASQVRDRFSLDGWVSLEELTASARRFGDDLRPGDDSARAMGSLLRQLAAFSGLVRENMYRFTGWRFLSMGRAIERAADMSTALALYADPSAPFGALELAVELGDSSMSHRRRFSVATNRETVVDLLGLDAMNPRSVFYQLDEVLDHVRFLPGSGEPGHMTPLNREIVTLHTRLKTQTPQTVDTALFNDLRGAMNHLSTLLSSAHLK